MSPMPINPRQTYVHLAADGTATPVTGGEAFWALPAAQLEHYGHGWLISEFEFDSDWPTWEMHPNADEIVYLLSGSVDLWLESPQGPQILPLRDSGAVVVPRGIWHTAKVAVRSRLLHVTLGAGTQVRPV